MADKEEVIKGLQEAVDWLSTETSLTVIDQWVVRDALALLKAQEPRVLTLDEVKASNGKDLILEYGQWGCEDNIVTAVTIEGCGSKGVSFALSVVCDYATYNRKHSFGWRCWTSRPTEEQRKIAKWDD